MAPVTLVTITTSASRRDAWNLRTTCRLVMESYVLSDATRLAHQRNSCVPNGTSVQMRRRTRGPPAPAYCHGALRAPKQHKCGTARTGSVAVRLQHAFAPNGGGEEGGFAVRAGDQLETEWQAVVTGAAWHG